MFSHCLHPSAQALPSSTFSSQQHLRITGHDQLTVDAQNDDDIALKNLVGNGTANAAQRWADHGKLLEKFAIFQDYLDKEEHVVVDKLLVPIDQPYWCPGNPCLILQNDLSGIKDKTRRLILPGIMHERVRTQRFW
jgi:hypothetical protein